VALGAAGPGDDGQREGATTKELAEIKELKAKVRRWSPTTRSSRPEAVARMVTVVGPKLFP